MIPLALLRRGLAGPASAVYVVLLVWWVLPIPGGRYAFAVLLGVMAWAMIEIWRVDLAWQVHEGRRATMQRSAAARSGPGARLLRATGRFLVPRWMFGLAGVCLACSAVARAAGLV